MNDQSATRGFEDTVSELDPRASIEKPLVMKFGGSLVEQLGAQLYPSVTATVAELISNAWDADAQNVWVQVPFEEDWSSPAAEILVLDDGHGMTRAAAQATYLVVGRKKRLTPHGDRSEGGRPVHGRKGIGKLAAFGTASYLECTTVRDGEETAFGLDYDELRRLSPDRDYYVDPITDATPLVDPSGAALQSGTRVRLTGLRVKRKISESAFITSMSRRFALKEMKVWINGRQLQRFSIPLEYRLPQDYNPDGLEVDADGWAHETLASGDQIAWWIGFTAKPLSESEQQGISVLARDKLAQRPFKFERSQGTTAQLGLEYLVGEVKADWIDSGDDIDTDLIQSNRDQLQLEDARLDEFLRWGQRKLAWSLRARQELRNRKAEQSLESDALVGAVLRDLEPQERRALTAVARRLARLPEVDSEQLADVMRAVVDSRESARLKEMSKEIEESSSPHDDSFWSLLDRTMQIDAERLQSVLVARVAALRTLVSDKHPLPAPELLASRIAQYPWLLNPSWSSYRANDHPGDLFEGSRKLVLLEDSTNTRDGDVVLVMPVVETFEPTRHIAQFRRAVHGALAAFPDRKLDAILIVPKIEDGQHSLTKLPGNHLERCTTWASAVSSSLSKHQDWLDAEKLRVAK